MALIKLDEFYPNYREDNSNIDDIKSFDVYSQGEDKVGSVSDILVDQTTGRFRYLVVDTGFWVFGKKVLLPVGLANIDYNDRRIYVNGLTKQQVENLPDFDNLDKVDFDYEERVRSAYRPMTATPEMNQTKYDRNTYSYEYEPSLYNMRDDMSDRNAQTLKLYEERLIADKQRRKTGEVTIGKHIETETARVAVPVEKERVIIERTTPTNAQPVNPEDADFREGEVARMEIYEETPSIRKEAVVREEVQVKKVVDRDTVETSDTVRREELDVDTQGRLSTDE